MRKQSPAIRKKQFWKLGAVSAYDCVTVVTFLVRRSRAEMYTVIHKKRSSTFVIITLDKLV